jgi:DNA-binding NarL/FixJ family response regulator
VGKHKILIVDDHAVVVEGIKSLLSSSEDFEVIGEAFDGHQGYEKAMRMNPDIVIMDLSMSGMNGLETTKRIKAEAPSIRIVVYTMHSDSGTILNLFKLGISAYVLKDGPITDLLMALEAVKRDATFFRTVAPELLTTYLQEQQPVQNKLERLSPREKQVFQFLAEGEPVKVIAERLHISRKTVETHKYHLMEKLKLERMIDLIRLAVGLNTPK